jgi:hypothetical protein
MLADPRISIIAFQIAQPWPRAHVASSAGSCSLNVRWLSPDRKVHAIGVSHAGSPIPHVPKSMTALSRLGRRRTRAGPQAAADAANPGQHLSNGSAFMLTNGTG